MALAKPGLAKLLADWGRAGDCGIVATTGEGEPCGAAWYRYWSDNNHSYGYVSSDVPELATAVESAHRGKGIGRALLKRLQQEAKHRGVGKLSLSVERDNPALALYETEGFNRVGQVGNAWTMVWNAFPSYALKTQDPGGYTGYGLRLGSQQGTESR